MGENYFCRPTTIRTSGCVSPIHQGSRRARTGAVRLSDMTIALEFGGHVITDEQGDVARRGRGPRRCRGAQPAGPAHGGSLLRAGLRRRGRLARGRGRGPGERDRRGDPRAAGGAIARPARLRRCERRARRRSRRGRLALRTARRVLRGDGRARRRYRSRARARALVCLRRGAGLWPLPRRRRRADGDRGAAAPRAHRGALRARPRGAAPRGRRHRRARRRARRRPAPLVRGRPRLGRSRAGELRGRDARRSRPLPHRGVPPEGGGGAHAHGPRPPASGGPRPGRRSRRTDHRRR